jgi:hypothetical protein
MPQTPLSPRWNSRGALEFMSRPPLIPVTLPGVEVRHRERSSRTRRIIAANLSATPLPAADLLAPDAIPPRTKPERLPHCSIFAATVVLEDFL